MAAYRPKSLDELNELYDKAKSAEQAFQKGKSLLKEENIYIETEFPIINTATPEAVDWNYPMTDGFSQVQSDKISEDIDHRLESLLSDVKAEEMPDEVQSIVYKSQDAPIKGKELSGLMDDYVKVMTTDGEYDEDDDYEESRRASFKKRRRTRKKDRYLEEMSDDMAVDIDSGVYDKELYDVDADNESQLSDDYSAYDEESDNQFIIDTPQNNTVYQTDDLLDSGEGSAVKLSGAKRVGSIITSVLLVIVLISTLIVGTINMTLKVNTGVPTFKATFFFTTSQDHPTIDIKKGDFVICQRQKDVEDGTSVAYIDRTNSSFTFGIKSETSKAKDDYGNMLYVVSGTSVKQSDVIGIIKANIPVIGFIVNLILDNYLAVLGGLVLLAIILTLVRCLAFRDTVAAEIEDDEEKKKKKSKKSKSKKAYDDDDYNEYEYVLNPESEDIWSDSERQN